MTNEEALKILKYRSGWDLSIRDVNALDMAIKALEQESESTYKYGILHKIAEFFQNWDGDENAKMEISVNDMREIADIFRKKARAERQLTEKVLDYNPNEWCHDCSEYNQDKHCCHRWSKVIRNTVEEMKQPCEDAISREDVIQLAKESDVDLRYADGVFEFLSLVKDLPSVHPKPKIGHWIEHPEIETSTPEYLMFYECSECGDKQCFCKSDIHKKHFCNNCGARMVEPQERNDKK